MKDRIIHLRFRPERAADPFEFEPETLDFTRGAELELRLATEGGDGEAATLHFGAVTFTRPESAEAFTEVSVSADGTRLKLRNLGSRERGGEVQHEYKVTVDYGGDSFTSGGYPSMNEHDPPP
jgi:hypothetical protein